jgi:hypothetical protein
MVDLIEAGLQAKEAEKERFFSLVSRLTESSDPKDVSPEGTAGEGEGSLRAARGR